jgi:hypothetical protein
VAGPVITFRRGAIIVAGGDLIFGPGTGVVAGLVFSFGPGTIVVAAPVFGSHRLAATSRGGGDAAEACFVGRAA